jgi:hypothetical protein
MVNTKNMKYDPDLRETSGGTVINSLHVKENYEHALDFALHLSRYFGLSKLGRSVYGSCPLSRTLVESFPRFSSHFFEVRTKFCAVSLSDPLRNRTSPDS